MSEATESSDTPERFEVQVSGSVWGGFRAYVPSLDIEVTAHTFEGAERLAVEAARAAGRQEPPVLAGSGAWTCVCLHENPEGRVDCAGCGSIRL